MPLPGNPVDRNRSDWTMNDERAMLEKTVDNRFNFFMVLVALISTSIARSESLLNLRLALGMGLVLALLFFFSIWKNERRLNAALENLKNVPDHPVAVLDKVIGEVSSKGVIGYVIPLTCIAILTVANILAWVLPR